MPIRNEAAHLENAVHAVLAQDYDGQLDLCLALAPSGDGTETIGTAIAAGDSRVTTVVNPAGTTPAGLNAAIRATDGAIVVRVDGHAELSDGYIRRAVESLRRTDAVNVGGIQRAEGTTTFERAVAAAMTSRLGTGGARFHVGGQEGPVDTVYLGVFRRTAIEAVGLFDESLLRNQDYELNIRLRNAGGTVWFDPQLSVAYRPRGSLRALARQYYEYGQWKYVVARLHPGQLRARQLVAPTLVVTLFSSAVLSKRYPKLLRLPILYVVGVGAAARRRAPRRKAVLTALATATMHLAWGIGFLSAALRTVPSRKSEG